MRTQFRFGLAALLFVGIGLAQAADPPSGSRSTSATVDPSSGWLPRLEFEGNTTYSAQQIREGLERNYDLALTLRRARPHDDLAQTIVAAVNDGYLHQGFPDVEVRSESDSTADRIRIQIVEGQRYRRGDVQVTGAKQVSSEGLIRRLTEPRYPIKAVPILREGGKESTEPVWVTVGGSKYKPKARRWGSGSPAPFDQWSLAEIRRDLEEAFQLQGYFSPRFEIAVVPDRSQQTATLSVTIKDEGEPAVVDDVVVKGANRSSRESLLEYLGIHRGMRYTARTPAELERRLWESGRFLQHSVSATFLKVRSEDDDDSSKIPPLPSDDGSIPDLPDLPDSNRVQLLVVLEENAAAPELGAKLSDVQEALLNASRWMERWSIAALEQELGLELTCKIHYPENEKPLQVLVRLAGGVERSAVLAVSLGRNGAPPSFQQTFAFTPDETVILSSRSPVRYESRFPATQQLALNLQHLPHNPSEEEGPDARESKLLVGFGWKSLNGKSANPFRIRMTMSPSTALRLSSLKRTTCRISDELLLINSEGAQIEFNARSGALRRIRIDQPNGGMTLAAQFESGIVDRALDDFARLRRELPGAAADAPRSDSISRHFAVAVGEFLAEESPLSVRPSVLALTKLISRWQVPPFRQLAETFGDEPAEGELFFVPAPRAEYSFNFQEPSVVWNSSMSGALIPILRSAFPRNGSFHEIGRDSLLAYPDQSVKRLLIETIDLPSGNEECGPISRLLQSGLTIWDKEAVASIARKGFLCLSENLFEKDVELLLSGEGWLSECLISLLVALRDLSPEEIRALFVLWPEEASADSIVKSFLEWKEKPETPADVALRSSIPQLWNRRVRSGLASVLLWIADRDPVDAETLKDFWKNDQSPDTNAEESAGKSDELDYK